MKEEWRAVVGYEGLYEVSNLGNIKSLRTNILLSLLKHYRYNYISISVALYKNNKRKDSQVSRLVATAFIPNVYNKPFVNHIDNNATNNTASNLEWVTHKENVKHAMKYNRYNKKVLN